MTLFSVLFALFFSFVKGVQLEATFSAANSGIDGYVRVDDGVIDISLDISKINASALPGGASCYATSGLSYHVHDIWNHTDQTDKIGSGPCSGTYTSGHFDPWAACGHATANTMICNAGCIPTTNYRCNSSNFLLNPYVCEVGDLSGKYGKIYFGRNIDNPTLATKKNMSYWELDSNEVFGKSIVFHCGNGGARAFCAPFHDNGMSNDVQTLEQPNTRNVYSIFDVLNGDSRIDLLTNGNIKIKLDASQLSSFSRDYGCTSFDFSIWNAWNPLPKDEKVNSLLGDGNCSTVVGKQYDPTNQCLPWSDSALCSDGKICLKNGTVSNTYQYKCDPKQNSRYSCSPSDLSGKLDKTFDVLENGGVFIYNYDKSQSLLPYLKDIAGKSIVIHCPKDKGGKKLACAKIFAESYAVSFNAIGSLIIAFYAMIFLF